MGARDQADAGAELDVVADGDGDVVEDGEVEVGEEAVTDAGVDAAVDLEGPAHVGVLSEGGEDLRQDPAASRVELVQGVVAAAQVVGAGLHLAVAGPGGVEEEAGASPFVLIIHGYRGARGRARGTAPVARGRFCRRAEEGGVAGRRRPVAHRAPPLPSGPTVSGPGRDAEGQKHRLRPAPCISRVRGRLLAPARRTARPRIGDAGGHGHGEWARRIAGPGHHGRLWAPQPQSSDLIGQKAAVVRRPSADAVPTLAPARRMRSEN